jgi:ketosteroid isomerase-like protein
VDLHRRGVAAIDAGELSDRVFAELCTPDFRLENTSTAVTDKTYRGADGVREWRSDFLDAFEPGARHEIDEVIAEGEDYVVSVIHFAGHGVGSGAPLVLRWINVTWFREGRMSRAVGYLSRREALEAVGLDSRSLALEHVELVRHVFDAHRARGIEAVLPSYTDDVTMRLGAGWIEDDIYQGHDAVRKLDALWATNFDEWSWEVHEIRDAGDRVVAFVEMTGQIRGSRQPVRMAQVLVASDFRGGKIGEVRFFNTFQEAQDAMGLDG